jgi:hypothetical protein
MEGIAGPKVIHPHHVQASPAKNGDCVVLRMIIFSTRLAAADLTGQAEKPPVLADMLVTLDEEAFAREKALHPDPFVIEK